MRLIRVLFLRLRNVFRSGRLDRDTRDELRHHYEQQIAAGVAAGLTIEEARRSATLEIGHVDAIVQASRDARGLAWWDALRGDLRYALRQVRTRPGFAAATILTLAIGVGASAAVFAVVDAVVLRPLPYPQADRLYAVYEFNTRSAVGRTRAAALNYIDWRDQATAFSGLAAHVGTGFTFTGRGEPHFTLGQVVTTNLLDVLQVTPALGRGFLPREAEAGNHQVVILSHGLWTRRFGADPAVVETITTINGQPHRIIGVLPPSFAFPDDRYALLVPLVTQGVVPDAPPVDRGARYLNVVGRLRPGVDPAAASAELDAIGTRLAQAYPDSNEAVSVRMMSLTDQVIGDASSNLVVVLVAVGFVLLIACVNVAGLSMARGQARARELAVRTAIGASRHRLVAQLTTEALVLFTIGSAVGIALAAWTVGSLTMSLPASLPRTHEVAIDVRFLLIAGGVTLLTGLIVSVLPAWQVARRGPAFNLAGARGAVSATTSTQRARTALMVVQVAVAVVLVTGAALALRSFQRLNAVPTGFTLTDALTLNVVLTDRRYPSASDIRQFISRMNDTLPSAAPGAIASVGTTTHLPLGTNNFENLFTVDGAVAAPGTEAPIAGVRGVTGQYRAALGARLIEGRDLTLADDNGQPVAVVTEGFARRYIEPRPVMGARIKMGGPDSGDTWRTVVGVIADIRHGGFEREPRPEVWMPLAHLPDQLITRWLRGVNVVLRTTTAPEETAPAVRAAMQRLDPELPLIQLRSLSDLARQSTAERRLQMSLLTAFATLALTLAAIGLFGVLAFYVAQHLPEFGVRLALGATPSTILSLVLRRGVLLLGIGVAIGLPASAVLGRAMSAVLFGIEPLDAPSLAAGVILVTVVTALACVGPARRAMTTDAVRVLKSD